MLEDISPEKAVLLQNHENLIWQKKEIQNTITKLYTTLGEEKVIHMMHDINTAIHDNLIAIQATEKEVWLKDKTIQNIPHIDAEKRKEALLNNINYRNRLMMTFSPDEERVIIHPNFYQTERSKNKYKQGRTQKRKETMKDLITTYCVIDPENISSNLLAKLGILDTREAYMTRDPELKQLKWVLAQPQYLYSQKSGIRWVEAWSRIGARNYRPFIFKTLETHQPVEEPTAAEKRKKTRESVVTVFDTSYEALTNQYNAINSIIHKKETVKEINDILKKMYEDMNTNKLPLNDEQKLNLVDITEEIQYQTNAETIMANLYKLSRIPDFNHRIIQSKLLQGASNNLDKRETTQEEQLSHMIPQWTALQDDHNYNKKTLEHVHQTISIVESNYYSKEKGATWEFVKWKRTKWMNISSQYLIMEPFYSMTKQIASLDPLSFSDEEKAYFAKILGFLQHIQLQAYECITELQTGKITLSEISIDTFFKDLQNNITSFHDIQGLQKNYFDPIFQNIANLHTLQQEDDEGHFIQKLKTLTSSHPSDELLNNLSQLSQQKK